MTEDKLIQILRMLSDVYPKKFEFPKATKAASKLMISSWGIFLNDYGDEIVFAAIKKLIINKPSWPPTVGEVVQEIEKMMMTEEDEITGPEAWEIIIDAIGKYSAIYNPEKVLESVPERVAKAAQVIGLNKIAMNDVADTFLMNRFIQTYEGIKEHDFERQLLPGNIRKDFERVKRKETEKLALKFKREKAIKGDIIKEKIG